MFIENKYKIWYFNIIELSKNKIRNKNDGYFEKHHIIPRCLNGKNTSDNLVLLTAREHYLCHKLLTKFTNGENKKKMLHAFWRFNQSSGNQKRKILTSHDYNIVREELSCFLKNERKGFNKGKFVSYETRKKLSLALKGKAKSEKAKQNMKESWKKRPPRSAEHCQALSESQKGKKLSQTTKQKMSDSKKGINPIHTQVSWKCEYCLKEGIGISNYKRWHGSNCKEYKNGQ